MNFASDNSGPAAPEILEAVLSANAGYENSYGGDSLMEKVERQLKEIFEAPDAAIYLVATGTAANALSLACLSPPWSTIFCHEHSHIQEDECGAPEFFTGGSKLTTVGGKHAKIDSRELAEAILSTGIIGVHNVQKGALSITNATELGAVYDLDEITELTSLATKERAENLAYTRFVLETGFSGDLIDLLTALLPCVMGYGEIGLRLRQNATADCYKEWIETYAGVDYQNVAISVGALVDGAFARRLGLEFEKTPRFASLCRRFLIATQLETEFWQMGLTP